MKLKKTIIVIMDRDTLKAVVEALEMEGIDRRSWGDMSAVISRSRRATPEMLLDYLNEKQVKLICEQMGISSRGRRKDLVKRLMRQEKKGKIKSEKTESSKPAKIVKQIEKKRQKESIPMADKNKNSNQNYQEQPPVRLPDPPVGMMRVTRTELVWPGKYNEDGTLKEVPRVSLPFQVIETVNESRADREIKKVPQQQTLFDVYEGKEGDSFEEGWKNKLIWGDNLLVMGSLLEKFAGKIDLIYIDPPFATGADFTFTTELGELGEKIHKDQSIIEEKAYRDTWGKGNDSFIAMIYQRLVLMRDLLADDGSIYVHCDWRVTQFFRMVMDEIFCRDHFKNEIIWCYKSGGAGSSCYAKKTRYPLLLHKN